MFGLGCGAGVAGLARATRLAHATDGAHVLFLTVDLCSLCMRANDPSPSMFVSTSLFGDGAAGVLLHNTRRGAHVAGNGAGPRILAIGEWCWRGTEHIMGWDIKDDGFGIVLSPELPALMSEQLRPALQDFLDRNGFRLSDFNGFLFHPGGRRLLETAQEVLGLAPKQLEHSWEVLRAFGNMSSATALFVLDRALQSRRARPASACRIRSGIFRLFRRGRSVMHFGWGAVLLAYLTAQRLAELVVGQAKRRRACSLSGGVEYGRSHLPLMQLLHAAWLAGMWLLAYDHSVHPVFFALFVAVQIARFWVLLTLGRRWTIRVIVVPGEKLVARGPYRWLRHPNYAIVIGEIAVVPLALGLPFFALIFSLLNAVVLSIRIPQENAALAVNAFNWRRK